MKLYMEKYDCFGNYYNDKLIEGFSHHTYTDRYCVGETPNIYKRVNLEKRDILKKNPCNSCWCKNKDKFKSLDNHHKYLYCKKSESSNGDIIMKMNDIKNKIKKYDRILLLKRSLEKLNNDEKLLNELKKDKVNNIDDKEIKNSIDKNSDKSKKLLALDNEIRNKKNLLSEKIDKILDDEEEQEEKDIISEKKEIDELNKKEIENIRKKNDDIIAEITKLKLTEQEKSMIIIKLKEEIEDQIIEINKLKKKFTGNKDNLMETKNLLFKCENRKVEKLICPNYNIIFFTILVTMIIYMIYMYLNFYDRLFVY